MWDIDAIPEKLNSYHGTLYRHLHAICEVSKFGKLVPHDVSEKTVSTELMCIFFSLVSISVNFSIAL